MYVVRYYKIMYEIQDEHNMYLESAKKSVEDIDIVYNKTKL